MSTGNVVVAVAIVLLNTFQRIWVSCGTCQNETLSAKHNTRSWSTPGYHEVLVSLVYRHLMIGVVKIVF